MFLASIQWSYQLRMKIITKILGSAKKAEQMLTSILFHVANVHSFPHLDLFPACLHGDIEDREWIPMGMFSMCIFLSLVTHV